MNFPSGDLPYQRPNKFFLSCLGLWPHQQIIQKRFFFLLSIFFIITQGVLQIGGLITAWEDRNIFLESIPPVTIDCVCYIKFLNFIYNADKMKKLLVIIEDDWKRYGVDQESRILREFGADCRKKTLFYAGAVFGSMIPFMLEPLLPIITNVLRSQEFSENNETSTGTLMFHVEYFVDVDKWYYYLLLHSYFATTIYITIVIAIDTMLLAYVQHACSLFAIIGYRLEHLVENDALEVNVYPPIEQDVPYKNIIECIYRHILVIRYVELIEKANGVSIFLQLGINVMCLTFTGFQTVSKLDQPTQSIRYASFMIAQAFPVFFVSYPSQCLLTESSKILHCFTRSAWYLTSIRTRKLLGIMMLRSAQPSYLTAANFYVLDMKFFAAVVRTSLSYLRMLYSFQ